MAVAIIHLTSRGILFMRSKIGIVVDFSIIPGKELEFLATDLDKC